MTRRQRQHFSSDAAFDAYLDVVELDELLIRNMTTSDYDRQFGQPKRPANWPFVSTRRGPALPDIWRVIDVPETKWQEDTCGISCLINWLTAKDVVRIDLLGPESAPIVTFQGSTDNVRKHTMAWLALYVPEFALDHAAYIGAELERADTERIGYVQDGKLDPADVVVSLDVERWLEFKRTVPAHTTFEESAYYFSGCPDTGRTFLVCTGEDNNIAEVHNIPAFLASIEKPTLLDIKHKRGPAYNKCDDCLTARSQQDTSEICDKCDKPDGPKSAPNHRYEIITVDEQKGKVVDRSSLESEHADLDVDPHNNENMPISLGSNQYIISLDDITNPPA